MISVKDLSIIYIGYIVPFSGIIPLAFGIYKFRYLEPGLRIITYYLMLSLFCSFVGTLFASQNVNNMPVIHIYTFLELGLLSWFFLTIFKRPAIRWSIGVAAASLMLFLLVDTLLFGRIYRFNNNGKSLEALLIILLAVCYFIRALDHTDKGSTKTNHPAFTYINAGLLLYFSSSLILFIITTIDPRYVSLSLVVWDMHASFLLLMFILFSIALWKYKV